MIRGVPYTANASIERLYQDGPLRRACERMTKRMLVLLDREVRRRTPVARPAPGVGVGEFTAGRGRPPGTLKESWRTTGVSKGETRTGDVQFSGEEYTEDPIAPHVEYRTRPHLIRPRVDRAPASVLSTRGARRAGTDPAARLRFVNRFGRVVYAREVHHPGTQGAHMMRDALAEVDATWVRVIGEPEMERWAIEQRGLIG